jgi:hypothetical protein
LLARKTRIVYVDNLHSSNVATSREFGAPSSVSTNYTNEWILVAGNAFYSGVANRINPGGVHLATTTEGNQLKVWGLPDGSVTVRLSDAPNVSEFQGEAFCDDTGLRISDECRVIGTSHNLLVVICNDSKKEGRIYELVFASKDLERPVSTEAVEHAIHRYFRSP